VTAQKGVLELIAAFNAASRLAPGGLARARLLIAGPLAGEYGDRVRQAASSSPAGGRIELLGGVYGEQKAELQAAADLFVTLSKNEGLSLAALEALASGVPVLLTPASNLPAIAAAGVGEITAAAEAEAAAALLRLLSGEAALAAMQSRAAAFAAENFSWQSVLPRLLDFYARTARSAAG
jgi:glycosyltransferase involved in cell wall biosynthesis